MKTCQTCSSHGDGDGDLVRGLLWGSGIVDHADGCNEIIFLKTNQLKLWQLVSIFLIYDFFLEIDFYENLYWGMWKTPARVIILNQG